MPAQSVIRKLANNKKAKILQGFFKTKKGEYGHGDIFLGLTVPTSRHLAKQFSSLSFLEISNLLKSKYHEERLIALLILVENFQKAAQAEKKKIFNFYLSCTKYINNWDLVDLSADKIVGAYLLGKPYNILFKLAKSENLWERRISIVATYQFIKNNQFKPTLEISKILLKDKHDLIHKAVGWMLREVGKKSINTERNFLNKYYSQMPRTSLRYAIERLAKSEREKYLRK